jgi:hypothetical protein
MVATAWVPLRSGLALAACAMALAGCSGTRFGDQLSRSFSAPPAQPVAPSPAAPNPGVPNPGVPNGAAPKTPGAQATAKPGASPIARPLPQVASPTRPAPYRITIQLPAADPAAPAEAVTEALRAAGVSFEVEMIERIGASTPTPAPTAPRAPAAQPAPTVTPAPAPR